MNIDSAVVSAILHEAVAAAPHECCGILFGGSDVISHHLPTQNIHATPRTHFEIDPQALIDAHRSQRAGGPRIAGYYHSHPAGPAAPSNTDQNVASGSGLVWAIVGQGEAGEAELRLWADQADGFCPLPCTAIER